jgi:hypothetical protein
MSSILIRIECQQGTTSVVPAFLMASVISKITRVSEFDLGRLIMAPTFSGCIILEIVASSQRFLRKDAPLAVFRHNTLCGELQPVFRLRCRASFRPN